MSNSPLWAIVAGAVLVIGIGLWFRSPRGEVRIHPTFTYSDNVGDGVIAPYVCTVTAGRLPRGITMDSCWIRGKAREAGDFYVTVNIDGATEASHVPLPVQWPAPLPSSQTAPQPE